MRSYDKGTAVNPLRWRKMTWAILLFTGLMGAWAIAALASTGDNCDQFARGTSSRSGCDAGTTIGTGLGVGALFCIWFLGFMILSIVWFMSRPNRRLCPVCGNEARRGQTVCKKCGFDFSAPTMSPVVATGAVYDLRGNTPLVERRNLMEAPGSLPWEESPAPLPPVRNFCRSCGQRITGTDRFCEGCGAPITPPTTD
jgi:hypothetical protein